MQNLSVPTTLTDEMRFQLDLEFLKVRGSAEDSEVLYSSLDVYFSDPVNQKADILFTHDYFRWYTELTWKKINILPFQKFHSLAISRQVYKALLLGYDVYDVILSYLEINSFTEEEMGKLYEQIKTAFFSSPCVIGKDKTGQVITLETILKKIGEVESEDTIKKAEFYSWMSSVVTIPEQYKDFYIVNTPDEISERIKGLYNFFIGVKRDNIFYIVNAYLHPRIFEDKQDESKFSEIQELSSEVQEITQPTPTFNYASIQSQIDSKFPTDETGQYTDIEGVFAYLEELAEQYNDERIKGLLYFDENTGGFLWVDEDAVPPPPEPTPLESSPTTTPTNT